MAQSVLVSHWALFWFLFAGHFHVYAFPWDGAQHTNVQQAPDHQGTSPAPTTAPTIPEKDLLRRQDQGQICGFADANINSAIQCAPGYQCAINPYNYAAGCCVDPYDCAYHTACVPYISISDCGAGCQSNEFVTKCTNAAQPYCYVKLYELSGYSNPFYEVDCDSIVGTLTVYQSYTNDAQQSVTPQLEILTTTASGPTTTMTQGSQATGGTVVNCGNGGSGGGSGSGSGGVTCNVGGGNNGNDAKGNPASRLDGGLMIRTLTWWVAMELFRWTLS